MEIPKSTINIILKKNLKEDNFKIKELTDNGNGFTFFVKTKNNKKCILRISKDKHSLQNNYLALKKLSKVEKVPKIISFGKKSDFYYSIETFLDGRKRGINKKSLFLLVKNIKEIHEIHNQKSGWLSDNSNKWKDYFFENHINNYEKRFKLRIKDWTKYFNLTKEKFPVNYGSFSLLHGDFSFTNSLYDGKKVNFFDFEDSFWGEKEYDLGMIYFMELLPKNDFLDVLSEQGYDKDKILFYSFCIGLRKVALARDDKHAKSRLKRLKIIYRKIISN